ncbi:conserved Plasmodium protein, unknown function [Plasmodium relictum]|uniref:Uncharacterized protein n=1 Tax=Plasmodium relictum TaxID=85471 RepID=A0A1J1HBH4_PLARL|nr:conserved Plasmodium protein, unknown function [Plasmodium relictum]CRH00778.1 conserved Plasmodium protein, unknown function [Plasmodium relictum]
MNELKELSKKIKENTTLKKEEKKNEAEIKNLFENLFSNNSINYISCFLNKANSNEKSNENIKDEIKKNVDNENLSINKTCIRNENNFESVNFAQEDTQIDLKLHIEKTKKSKESLESGILENNNIDHIDIRKVLQNKKNIEFKDFNKLIDSFNEEIEKRSTNLENLINKNKIKNDYSDQFLMLEKFNAEIKNFEKNLEGNDNLHRLYLIRKKKKKNYDSLVFFKNFFNCLKNFIYFLDKSEKNYEKLKIFKSLIYLRNCKEHILLIKVIFKYLKKTYNNNSSLNDNENRKIIDEEIRKNVNKNIFKGSSKNDTILSDNINEEISYFMNSENSNKNDIKYFNIKEKNNDFRLMDDLKKLFHINSNSMIVNKKIIFLKDIKIKYDNILNNLKSLVQIIFEKMFIFNGNIMIYKYIYLNSGDVLKDGNNKKQKFSYSMFWHIAYILKEHVTYLEKIKNHIFFHFFKFLVLIYCIIKNLNAKEILNNFYEVKNIHSLKYENIKNFVKYAIRRNNSNSFLNNSFNFFEKYKNYLFYIDDGKISNDNLTNEQKEKVKDFCFTNINLIDYIVDNEDHIFIDMESFFSNIFLLMKNIKKIHEKRKYSYKEEYSENGYLKREDLKVKNDIILVDDAYISEKNKGKSIYQDRVSYKNKHCKNYNDNNNNNYYKIENDYENSNTNDNNTDNIDHNNNNDSEKCNESSDFFSIFSRSLLDFYNFVELLFVINKDEKNIFDVNMKQNFYSDEFINIFNFYFDDSKNETKSNFIYFNKYEFHVNDEEKLSNIKEKLKKKYQCIEEDNEEENEENQLKSNKFFSFYILNKELNENIFSSLHKMNLKRNNLRNIHNIYHIYKWKKEENKFLLLIKNIFKNNFFYYLNHTYFILNDIFMNKKNEYILIDENIDDYIFNYFFDLYNYDLKNIKEINYNIILNYIEEKQEVFQKNIKEQIEKNIVERNTFKSNIEKKKENKVNENKIIFKINEGNINNEPSINTEKSSSHEQEKKDINFYSNINNINIIIKHSNLDLIRIHKNLIYIVFNIYSIVFLSYKILFEIKKNKEEKNFQNDEDKKNAKLNFKDKKLDKEKLKYIININMILFSYKVIKYIYNIFLSYSFFIFRFTCFMNMKNDEQKFLLSVINDNIFLKKVLENINNVYLNYKDLFHFHINEKDIIFENFDLQRNYKFINENKGTYTDDSDINDKDISLYNKSDEIELKNDHLKYSSYDKKEHKIIKRHNKEHFKISKNKFFLLINKISILKKVHLFIDKFHINLNSFKKILLKNYKQNFSVLLKKDIIFIEENFLINASKIVNIIFEFFQIQDLSKSTHKEIVLSMIDYFFYLINEQIYNFVFQKINIDENERIYLYEKFVLIPNSLFFILKNYKEYKLEEKNTFPYEENYFLKNVDEMFLNLTNLKKNKILFLLLFCKVKYILNSKKTILEFFENKNIEIFLLNNPHAHDDENLDAILNEFK